MTTTYVGNPDAPPKASVRIDGEGFSRVLPHFPRHSPDGFSWGYLGSGPSELARCLLIDALGVEGWCDNCGGSGGSGRMACSYCGGTGVGPAVENNYQAFKADVIATFDQYTSWSLPKDSVLTWYRHHTRVVADRA